MDVLLSSMDEWAARKLNGTTTTTATNPFCVSVFLVFPVTLKSSTCWAGRSVNVLVKNRANFWKIDAAWPSFALTTQSWWESLGWLRSLLLLKGNLITENFFSPRVNSRQKRPAPRWDLHDEKASDFYQDFLMILFSSKFSLSTHQILVLDYFLEIV